MGETLDIDTALVAYTKLLREACLADRQKLSRIDVERARNAEDEHRKRVIAAFAELNGWYRVSSQNFRPQDIGKQRGNSWFDGHGRYGEDRAHEYMMHESFDHGLWFRQKLGRGHWRNIAIVGQPYDGAFESKDGRPRLDAYCARHRLKWVMAPNPKASFHYPGETLFLVVTLPEVEVKWLPEQIEQVSFPDPYARDCASSLDLRDAAPGGI